MKILWLSPRWPLPDDTGARKATLTLLKELVPAGKKLFGDFELDLVCLHDGEPSQENQNELSRLSQTRRHLYLKKRQGWGGDLISYAQARVFTPDQPYTMFRYSGKALSAAFTEWSAGQSWDFTIIDGLHAAGWVDLSLPQLGTLIYRAHNVEADLWKQLAQKQSGLKKVIFQREYELYQAYEDQICQKSRAIYAVSDLDAQKFKQHQPELDFRTLPIGFNCLDQPLPWPVSTDALKLLFVGRLDWLPNREGLQWFLQKVWPEVRGLRKAELTIIGSGDSSWLDNEVLGPQDRVLRNVPELKSFYQDCHLSLVPLFMGSGTRVKAIESGSYGRALLTTAIGIEGLPFVAGQDYFLAETAEQWIATLTQTDLSQMQIRGEALQQKTKSHFDQKILAENFLKAISKRP